MHIRFLYLYGFAVIFVALSIVVLATREHLVSRSSVDRCVFLEDAALVDYFLVTSCGVDFFDRLENLVGSVHFFEPDMKIVVYDLGLTGKQREAVRCWANTELRVFRFDHYPPHFRTLANFAWKPLVLLEALELYQNIMYVQ